MDNMIDQKSGWLFTPEINRHISAESEEEFFNNPAAFKTIIESIQDGVSILDTSLNIKYLNATMRHIYAHKQGAVGKKCYAIYHGLSAPCADCPSLQCLETKKPQTGVVRYWLNEKEYNMHQLFSIPILNSKNEIVLIMEYVRDITFQTSMTDHLNELTQRFEVLEKQNELLADLLVQRERSKTELEETISSNVERFIKPSLEYLKKTVHPGDIELVNGLIDEIVYPITKKRSTAMASLTPRELQVASLIKEGFSSKEIAGKMCVTQKAVDYHRLNIRKKLKLPRDVNLRTHLELHL